jgi:serine protease
MKSNRVIVEFESIDDREKYIQQLDKEYKLLDSVFIGVIHDKTSKVRSLEMVKYIQDDQKVKAEIYSDIITDCGVYWHLDRISQRELPLNKIYQYKKHTNPVHVYIMDTGVNYDHPEFGCRAKRVFNAYQEISGNVNYDHGTHVAGIVGGITTGVNKCSKIYDVKILDNEGSGYLSDVLLGMDWIKSNHMKPAIVNMSFSTRKTSFMDTAIRSLYNAGITMIAAAGNEKDNACNYSPGSSQYVIAVGSSNINDERSSFSNFGSCVDIYAPGSDIVSTSFNNRLATKSGTSMSCAIVSGVASAILQEQPIYTPSQLKLRLLEYATKDINKDITPFIYKPVNILEINQVEYDKSKDILEQKSESKKSNDYPERKSESKGIEYVKNKTRKIKKSNVSYTFIHIL